MVEEKHLSSSFKPALLTKTETEWLLGKTQNPSKSFEYKMKSTIRKKLHTLVKLELPLLVKNNFISYESTAIGRDLEPGTYDTTTKEINTCLGLIFTLNTNVKIMNIISHNLRGSSSEIISQLAEAFNHSLDIRNIAVSLDVSVSNMVIGFKEIPIEPPIQLGKREFKIKNLTQLPDLTLAIFKNYLS